MDVLDIPKRHTMSESSSAGNIYPKNVVMESIRIRKVKQKIAQKMVKVNALNVSRPRTDKGQPFLGRVRSFTDKRVDKDVEVFCRTVSDPEFLHCRNRCDGDDALLENDQLNEEFHREYENNTVENNNQLPVQSIITDFNRISTELTPNSKTYSVHSNTSQIQKKIDTNRCKQKPTPVPRSKITSSLHRPVPPPRITYQKSKSLSSLDTIENDLTESKIIQRKTSKFEENSQKVIKQKNNKDLENEENTEDDLILLTPNGNSEINYNHVAPYEVVDLKFSNTKSIKKKNYNISVIPSRPVSCLNDSQKVMTSSNRKSSLNDLVYTDMSSDDSYLKPVDSTSPEPPKSPIKSPKTPNGNITRKEKTNKQRVKKGKSLNYTKSALESTLADIIRRKSEPQFATYENNDILDDRPEYESMDDVCNLSDDDDDDDEVWGSDEFDEFEENEYEIITETKIIPKLPELDPVSRKVYNIVTEILTTERAYVKRLYLLDEIFHQRLRKEESENNIVPEKTINEIFSNLTPIYQFHSNFLLPELEKRVFQWIDNRKIGDIFKNLGNFLKLYTVFVKNFDHATNVVTHLMKKVPKFAAVVEELQKRPECENLSLQHHMLEPIQRVPRYKLLLQDYLKRLPQDAPDRKEAEDSLEIISKIAQEANNSMKEIENFKKLLDIEDRIFDGLKGQSLVTASRILLKEGELTKLAARKGSNTTNRIILLFTDILLCCATTTTNKLRVRQIMDVEGLKIDEDETLPEHAFRIKSRQRVLDLIARDQQEKDDWMSAIQSAVDALHDRRGNLIKAALEKDEQNSGIDKPGKQAPVWVKDEDVTMCMLCAVKFGLVHRKHHCRGCGRVTCDRCSNYKAFLEYANSNARVCFACSKKLGLDVRHTEDAEFKQSAKARDSNIVSDVSNILHWKSPGKGWSKEYIALCQFVLYIQKKRQDVKAHSTLPVPGFTVAQPASAEEIESSHPFCIKLHKGNKKEHTYYISSDSKDIIELWRKHLECAVQLQTYTPPS